MINDAPLPSPSPLPSKGERIQGEGAQSMEEAMTDDKVLPAELFLEELRRGLRDPKRDRTNHPFV